MKKLISLLLSLTILVISMAVLSSCGCDGHADVAPADGICDLCEDELCKRHKDANADGICDECDAEVCTIHTDTNGDGKCDNCAADVCLVHVDLSPADGSCDECGAILCTVHTDDDVDGKCDACAASVCVAHADAENDDVCDNCGANVDVPRTAAQGIADTVLFYANSEPLMIQANGEQKFYEYDDTGKEFVAYTLGYNRTLKTGKVNGKIATVEIINRDVPDQVSADGKKRPLITTLTTTREFVQGKGVRQNVGQGGDWAPGANFAPAKGAIAINLDPTLIQNATYVEAPYNNVLTFAVAKANVKEVLGADFADLAGNSGIVVTVTNDGAVVTGITITYGIKATGNFPKSTVTCEIKYDYSVQRIDLFE